MAEKLSRQQIYDRIRATSKDSYILEHGFLILVFTILR